MAPPTIPTRTVSQTASGSAAPVQNNGSDLLPCQGPVPLNVSPASQPLDQAGQDLSRLQQNNPTNPNLESTGRHQDHNVRTVRLLRELRNQLQSPTCQNREQIFRSFFSLTQKADFSDLLVQQEYHQWVEVIAQTLTSCPALQQNTLLLSSLSLILQQRHDNYDFVSTFFMRLIGSLSNHQMHIPNTFRQALFQLLPSLPNTHQNRAFQELRNLFLSNETPFFFRALAGFFWTEFDSGNTNPRQENHVTASLISLIENRSESFTLRSLAIRMFLNHQSEGTRGIFDQNQIERICLNFFQESQNHPETWVLAVHFFSRAQETTWFNTRIQLHFLEFLAHLARQPNIETSFRNECLETFSRLYFQNFNFAQRAHIEPNQISLHPLEVRAVQNALRSLRELFSQSSQSNERRIAYFQNYRTISELFIFRRGNAENAPSLLAEARAFYRSFQSILHTTDNDLIRSFQNNAIVLARFLPQEEKQALFQSLNQRFQSQGLSLSTRISLVHSLMDLAPLVNQDIFLEMENFGFQAIQNAITAEELERSLFLYDSLLSSSPLGRTAPHSEAIFGRCIQLLNDRASEEIHQNALRLLDRIIHRHPDRIPLWRQSFETSQRTLANTSLSDEVRIGALTTAVRSILTEHMSQERASLIRTLQSLRQDPSRRIREEVEFTLNQIFHQPR